MSWGTQYDLIVISLLKISGSILQAINDKLQKTNSDSLGLLYAKQRSVEVPFSYL